MKNYIEMFRKFDTVKRIIKNIAAVGAVVFGTGSWPAGRMWRTSKQTWEQRSRKAPGAGHPADGP